MTKMNIKTLLDTIDTLTPEQREAPVRSLCKHLTAVSLQSLDSFQREWDPAKGTFGDFIACQNQVIKTCIKLETCELGALVREQFRLQPLALETEL